MVGEILWWDKVKASIDAVVCSVVVLTDVDERTMEGVSVVNVEGVETFDSVVVSLSLDLSVADGSLLRSEEPVF
jgi:hypothetical protein